MNVASSNSAYALESFSLRGLPLEHQGPCQPPVVKRKKQNLFYFNLQHS